MNNNFIKINRDIIYWGGYTNANSFRIYMHLLLIGYWDWENNTVETKITIKKIAEQLNINVNSVRTTINKLIKTGKIQKNGKGEMTHFFIKNVIDCKSLSNKTQIKLKSFSNYSQINSKLILNHSQNDFKSNSNTPQRQTVYAFE